MDIDLVESMKVKELVDFLRLRGLKIGGRKKELVARAWSAMEQGVPIKLTAEQVEAELKTEYESKLFIDNIVITNPFDVGQDWKGEDEGIIYWPMILYPDIYNYLSFYPSELPSKDLSDYKNCKAYSYFKTGWLQPLHYHNISIDSKFCILKGECRKSERISDPFHKLWVIVEKKSARIRSAHCTCMAGMSQTCNHVAAALFRVEAAVRLGFTNPACTSLPSAWLPNRKEVTLSKVKDMDFSREDFGQRGKKKRPLTSSPKKRYNPLDDNNLKLLSLQDIATALEEVVPTSIIFQAVASPEIDFVREVISTSTVKPDDLASIDDILIMSDNKAEFNENISYHMTINNIARIEVVTRGQSCNEFWYSFRKGVITASKGHDVMTKMAKIRKGGGVHVKVFSLNQRISGLCYTSPDIPALKYGRAMEVDAANCVFDIMKGRHKDLELTECGLYLHKEAPFVGASPDRIMKCSCCRSACVEVKCPYSINHTTPQDGKLSYLVKENGLLKLNRSHKYFTQCQIQMGVTGLKICYFLVWTPHGYFLEVINFDSVFFRNIVSDFVAYYNDFYLRTIFMK